ncbi:MAG: ABC transporter permease [Zetaproteobacteria bacterium]|nr:MAG: ABC transporter permease [Zetaproteobacteria bacterium]
MSEVSLARSWGIYAVLGWRNLWLHPLRTFLTASALAVGIAALIFLSAMDDGWMQQIKRNFALTVTGHIQIHARGFEQTQRLRQHIQNPAPLMPLVRAQDGVKEVVLRVRASGLASSAGANAGVLVFGVEPEAEARLSRLSDFLVSGSWLRSDVQHEVLLGDGLADRLQVGLGDKVVLMAAAPDGEIASEVFRVRGLLHSGVLDIDDLFVIAPLPKVQQWLGLGQGVTDIVIRVTDDDRVTPVWNSLRSLLDGDSFEVLRWNDIDPMAEQWAEFADVYTWIILLIVIVVVLAEVLNTMLMSMHERVREFGLMMALGARAGHIFVMILWETIVLVALGAVAGFVLGGVLVFWFGREGIDLTRFAVAFSFMYMDPVVYPRFEWSSMARIIGASLVGALMAGILPALRAARLVPARALREL